MQGISRKGIFLILIALSSLFLVSSLLNVRTVAASSTPLTGHHGISVHSDKEFTLANGVVSGSGTQADPYVITSWDIDVSTNPVTVTFSSGTALAGILIANTTAYAIVRNVQVHGPALPPGIDLGIVLWNATHVIVESSRVWNGTDGVALIGSSHCTIDFNELYNLVVGIGIAGGIPSSASIATNNLVFENNIHDVTGDGLNLVDAYNSIIANNSISNMLAWATFIDQGSTGIVFTGNHVTNSAVGIETVDSSLNNTIVANFFDVQILGIGVGFGSNGTIVRGNEIHSLQGGINLIETTRSVVSGNTVQANETGIKVLEGTTANRVIGNVIIAHIGLFFCGTKIGLNRFAPNDLNGSDLRIEFCN